MLIKEKNISIKTVISAIVIAIVATASAPAQANALNNININQRSNALDFLSISTFGPVSTPAPVISVQEPKPEPIDKPPSPEPDRKYTVQPGDNLSKIAAENDTTWPRLWNRNTDLKDPHLIYSGQILIIPPESEILDDRPVPIPAQQAQTAAPGVRSYNSAGNTYAPGNCTWYVKNKRPDLPGDLGNANTWQYRAQAYGLPTGSTPRAGAVGTTGAGDLGHVVYVERVNGDGTILISEMNFAGLYSERTRTANASEFSYIY